MQVRKAKYFVSAWLQEGPRGMFKSPAPGMHSQAGTKRRCRPSHPPPLIALVPFLF